MVRLAFNRKNKMLRSVFTTKSVLTLLEDNFKTFCALSSIVRGQVNSRVDLPPWAGPYHALSPRSPRHPPLPAPCSQPLPDPLPDMEEVVTGVLAACGLSDARAAKLDLDDFLMLLAEFNKAGIHFS